MPKLLVLFHSRTGRTAALADAMAEGAKSVRFAEVDVRLVHEVDADGADGAAAAPAQAEIRERLGRRYRAPDPASLAGYDAIILGAPASTRAVPPALARLLEGLGPPGRDGALPGKVGSAFAPAVAEGGEGEATLWSLLTSLGKLGMILVPPAHTDRGKEEGELAAARDHGRRVATVVEWVAHAKSHAHGHAHGH
jgi:NAD(P)H dehydrogenase (quinone)